MRSRSSTFSTTIQLLILLTLTSIPIPTSFAAATSYDGGTKNPPPTIPLSRSAPSTTHSGGAASPPPIPLSHRTPSTTHAGAASAPPPSIPSYDSTTHAGDSSAPPPIPVSHSGVASAPPPIGDYYSTPATTYSPQIPTSYAPPPLPYSAADYPPPIPAAYSPAAYPPPNPYAAAPAPPIPYTPSIFATVLNQLGYTALAAAAEQANLTAAVPITIFAPSDSSLLTCPTCSLTLLLQEHCLPGLYSLHYLRSLTFGTKIETLAPNRCLSITATPSAANPAAKKVFVNGVEITKPDLFNDGFLIIHGLQGFVSHLSQDSCLIERQTTMVYPSQPLPTADFQISRMLLKDAMMRLRVSGYSVVALAMRVKYWELCYLKGLTIFALDDASIFAGGIGHSYVADIGYHIVPNRLLMGSDLEEMPQLTVLPTMERWRSLVVTTANGGGPMMPMRINYVKIKTLDLVHNNRIVVHGLSMPFPHVDDPNKYQ